LHIDSRDFIKIYKVNSLFCKPYERKVAVKQKENPAPLDDEILSQFSLITQIRKEFFAQAL
jgi:hypothetical protein